MHVTHCYISPQHKGQLHQFLHIKVCLKFTEESRFLFFLFHASFFFQHLGLMYMYSSHISITLTFVYYQPSIKI